MLARVLAGDSEDFTGQQAKDDAILVGAPDRTVLAQKRGPCGLFTAEAAGA